MMSTESIYNSIASAASQEAALAELSPKLHWIMGAIKTKLKSGGAEYHLQWEAFV